jgi:PucR C-terminal helix-turn-helix domain
MNRAERPHLQALSSVSSSLVTGLRPVLPEVGDEIIAAIRESVPDYARPLEGSFGRGVRAGVGEALRRFVDDIERPGADPERWRSVYFNLGRGELRQGRTLEALLAAYRVGARVAWRRVAEAASAGGATAEELTALAEAIFAYIDEISAISAEGYAAEQAEAARESQRRREAVVLLLSEGGAGAESIARAADAAGWPLPRRAAAVLVRARQPSALATRLGQDVIAAGVEDELVCAIVPDAESPGRRREIDAALGDRVAAIGPAVEPGELATSFERARLTLTLIEAGGIAGPARATDHLPTLIVNADPGLLAEHARRELAPLDGETELSRARLLETLHAWVDHPGRPTEVARTVQVHPQTARYRLRRLRELFGDIDDPDRRFALALALRAGLVQEGGPAADITG